MVEGRMTRAQFDETIEKMSKEASFVCKEDWANHQICGDYPIIDVRSFAFCCSAAKACPWRMAALRALGLDDEALTELKIEFGERIQDAMIGVKKDPRDPKRGTIAGRSAKEPDEAKRHAHASKKAMTRP